MSNVETLDAAKTGERPDLRSMDSAVLEAEITGPLEEKPFRARQIFKWLHKRSAASFDEMTDLSLPLRETLRDRYRLDTLAVCGSRRSVDGTSKLALQTRDGHVIEVVHIPEWHDRKCDFSAPDKAPDRSTLCISTQVGCAMGCSFCRTAKIGLVRDLSAGEIVDQVYRACVWLREQGATSDRPISNLVFMGMGEPLANYESLERAVGLLLSPEGMNFSHRHVTVSTCGHVPGLERLGRETEVKVAISLTGTTDEVRDELMPVNRRWPIERLLAACRRLPIRRGRRITFEYVLLKDMTDSMEDADRLARLLEGIPSKINLISYNECPGLPYERSPEERVIQFRERLASKGLTVVVRRSRGSDIEAACGQLAARSD